MSSTFYGSDGGAFVAATDAYASKDGAWHQIPLGGGECPECPPAAVPGYYALGGTANSGIGAGDIWVAAAGGSAAPTQFYDDGEGALATGMRWSATAGFDNYYHLATWDGASGGHAGKTVGFRMSYKWFQDTPYAGDNPAEAMTLSINVGDSSIGLPGFGETPVITPTIALPASDVTDLTVFESTETFVVGTPGGLYVVSFTTAATPPGTTMMLAVYESGLFDTATGEYLELARADWSPNLPVYPPAAAVATQAPHWNPCVPEMRLR
jgi:hypothetical protein